LLNALERLRVRAARGRGKCRLSLTDVATMSGVPRSSLANYLSGASFVPADQLDAIVLALGVAPADAAVWALAWERVAEHRMSNNCVPKPEPTDAVPAAAHSMHPTILTAIVVVAVLTAIAVAIAIYVVPC
jgi:transcriptional regulator with XRE-family HTH domain